MDDLIELTTFDGQAQRIRVPIAPCRSVEEFEKLNRIGEGTYGVVYRARDRRSGNIVALKKIRLEPEPEDPQKAAAQQQANSGKPQQLPPDGLPLTHFREILLLQSTAQHPNIVHLHEIAVGRLPGSIFMVMDYCTHDLAALLDSMRVGFTPSEIKCLMYQLLRGVEFLHKNCIIHRDLKLSNLLMEAGVLKIADFGLARKFGTPPPSPLSAQSAALAAEDFGTQVRKRHPMTPRVVTLWYRAPELLYGTSDYTTSIDMWSVGCIFGELLLHTPLLPGKTELDQLTRIANLIGSPSDADRSSFSSLPLFRTMGVVEGKKNCLRERFSTFTDGTVELLNGLLTYSPVVRWRYREALDSKYFTEPPKRIDPKMMRTFPDVRFNSGGIGESGSAVKKQLSAQVTAAAKPITPGAVATTSSGTSLSNYLRRKAEASQQQQQQQQQPPGKRTKN